MTELMWAAAAFCLASVGIHLLSSALATLRCQSVPYRDPPADAPPVSVIQPVCGLDNFAEETLRSTFRLDYPRYEILFCAAQARDPAVALVERLIAEHPKIPARLLIGDDRINDNPKLNNIAKGWRAASHDWIVIADSNVLLPADAIQRLLARWQPDTGLVCSPPVGCMPQGLAAELECAMLNTFEARWQYAADTVGLGFAQGKAMCWHRSVLERGGGIRALAAELAEDAAATKVVRGLDLRVRLVDAPFGQPLGLRTFREVWRRQVRWSRLRRVTFPLIFAAEILPNPLWAVAAAGFVASEIGYAPWPAAVAVAALCYGAEALIANAAAWHMNWRAPLLWLVRDLLLPVLWVEGWLGHDFSWRGNAMTVSPERAERLSRLAGDR
jgi:ceramide glucosyltransferase